MLAGGTRSVRRALVALALLATSPEPILAQGADDAKPAIVEWINRQLTVPQTTLVIKAPRDDAETIGRLRQGASIRVLGVVAGGVFLQVKLPDGQTTGYVLRDVMAPALAPSAPSPVPSPSVPAPRVPSPQSAAIVSPKEPAPPKDPAPQAAVRISGSAVVADTGALMVGGRLRTLAGLQGLAGTYAKALQQYIEAKGGVVSCENAGAGTFTCFVPNGGDVAMAALLNGAAMTTPGAPESYLREQEAARSAHRGVWQQASNAEQPPAAENAAPSSPSNLGLGPHVQARPSGRWLSYSNSADGFGSRICGIETAWRGGTAHLALDVVGSALVLSLRDEGWEFAQPISGGGEIFVDRRAVPASFEHQVQLGPMTLAGRIANAADGAALLTQMKAGNLLWVTSPAGRTPALSLVGAGAAIDTLARCLRLEQ